MKIIYCFLNVSEALAGNLRERIEYDLGDIGARERVEHCFAQVLSLENKYK